MLLLLAKESVRGIERTHFSLSLSSSSPLSLHTRICVCDLACGSERRKEVGDGDAEFTAVVTDQVLCDTDMRRDFFRPYGTFPLPPTPCSSRDFFFSVAVSSGTKQAFLAIPWTKAKLLITAFSGKRSNLEIRLLLSH